MKRVTAIILALVISAAAVTAAAVAAETVYAAEVLHAAAGTGVTSKPTASRVLVNGAETSFDAYNIAGNNYFKLRDIAFALNGTAKRFSVDYDAETKAITLVVGAVYVTVGGEMNGKGAGEKQAVPTSSKIYLDGKEAAFTAYLIGGNNYFKLRDIGRAFDFGADWDAANKTIVIDTGKKYTEEAAASAKPTKLAGSLSEVTDINVGDEIHGSLEFLRRYGALYIYNDGTFKPKQYITYGELIEMLGYVAGSTYKYSAPKDAHWAEPYADYLSATLYFVKELDRKKLDKSVTKLDLIRFCVELYYVMRNEGEAPTLSEADIDAILSAVKDADTASLPYFTDSAMLAVSIYLGWYSPDKDGNLYLDSFITRAEAVRILCYLPR